MPARGCLPPCRPLPCLAAHPPSWPLSSYPPLNRAQDADPQTALSCPRTKVGDKLGRVIVNRLKVRREGSAVLSWCVGAALGCAVVAARTDARLPGALEAPSLN